MTTYECDNLYFEKIEYPEIPYKIGEPLENSGSAAKVDKRQVKGGRSPPFVI